MDYLNDELFSDVDLEWISQKKSELLSVLINELSDDDIPIDEYHHFEYLIPKTLDFPDEIYDYSCENYQLRVVVSAYQLDKQSYQVLLGCFLKSKDQFVFVPILSYQTYFLEKTKIFVPNSAVLTSQSRC